jgi:hypothetical protein
MTTALAHGASKFRSTALRFLICFILGAATSLCVSSYLAALTNWHLIPDAGIEETRIETGDTRGPRFVCRLRTLTGKQKLTVYRRMSLPAPSPSEVHLPAWSEASTASKRGRLSVSESLESIGMWDERGAGWPMISARSIAVAPLSGRAGDVLVVQAPFTVDQVHFFYSARCPTWLSHLRFDGRPIQPIPYRPWWPGLALNTAFYGAAWALLLGSPLLIRRGRSALRRHRGCCPSCAYDLKGWINGGCPECGWNRKQEFTTPVDRPAADPGVARSSA